MRLCMAPSKEINRRFCEQPAQVKGSSNTRRDPLTAAPFRVWRGSQACAAEGSTLITAYPRQTLLPSPSENPSVPL